MSSLLHLSGSARIHADIFLTHNQLPLSDFGYTAAGNMIESGDEMDKENIEMIGFSVLGGNAGLQGPYELVLDEIYATRDIDVD